MPVFMPREFHRQRSLAGYSPWGHKEADETEQLTFSLFMQIRLSHQNISRECIFASIHGIDFLEG